MVVVINTAFSGENVPTGGDVAEGPVTIVTKATR